MPAESPQLRRLRADQERLQQLVGQSDLIKIISTEGNPPNKYLIEFTCRGIERLEGTKPIYREQHQMNLMLPANYPSEKPNLVLKTPIFHPNIVSQGGVCIGPWYAAKWLDELVFMVAEMIQYKIPPTRDTLNDVLNHDAAQWLQKNRHLFPIDKRDIKNSLLGTIRILDDDDTDEFSIKIL